MRKTMLQLLFRSVTITVFVLRFTTPIVHATLHDRGYGFIYDDVLDVTWYDFTFQGTTWHDALFWADSLALTFPDTGITYTDWRLPTAPDSPYKDPYVWGTSGIFGNGSDPDGLSHNWGYNLTESELGHLFYEELKNPGGYNTDGSVPLEWGLLNTGPFTNLIDVFYWTSTTYGNYPTDAWLFNFYNGCLQKFMKTGWVNAIALHDGDISIPNHAPIITPINNMVIEPGILFELAIEVYDPDPDDTVHLTASNLPPDAWFDPETGILNWIPTPGSEGNYMDITITARDDGRPQASAVETFTITVGLETNRPPEFPQRISKTTIKEYETIEFTIEAIDPDGDLPDYEAILPEGASFDPDNGLFRWTPTSSQQGTHILTFRAIDSAEPELKDHMNVTITVEELASPEELAAALSHCIESRELPDSVRTDYIACLQKARQNISQKSNMKPAIKKLETLSSLINDDIAAGIINMAAGDFLIEITAELIDRLTLTG